MATTGSRSKARTSQPKSESAPEKAEETSPDQEPSEQSEGEQSAAEAPAEEAQEEGQAEAPAEEAQEEGQAEAPAEEAQEEGQAEAPAEEPEEEKDPGQVVEIRVGDTIRFLGPAWDIKVAASDGKLALTAALEATGNPQPASQSLGAMLQSQEATQYTSPEDIENYKAATAVDPDQADVIERVH